MLLHPCESEPKISSLRGVFMQMMPIRVAAATTLIFSLSFGSWAQAASQTVVSGEDASRVMGLTDMKANVDTVSGVLVNKSAHPIREVELLVDHVWFWSDERHPGEDNPGRSEYYTVHGEVQPHGSLPFTYHPSPPLARRDDGHFETSVQIVGFVEVGQEASGQ
jgi:hypothetical protein